MNLHALHRLFSDLLASESCDILAYCSNKTQIRWSKLLVGITNFQKVFSVYLYFVAHYFIFVLHF